MPEFLYSDLLPTGDSDVVYLKVTDEYVSTFEAGARQFLKVEAEGLRLLTAEALSLIHI